MSLPLIAGVPESKDPSPVLTRTCYRINDAHSVAIGELVSPVYSFVCSTVTKDSVAAKFQRAKGYFPDENILRWPLVPVCATLPRFCK